MPETDILLSIHGLALDLGRDGNSLVSDLDLDIRRGDVHTLLGESGSGKTLTALAVLRLLPPGVHWRAGEVRFDGQNLPALPEREMRQIRGRRIAMIFQEPQTSLNPVMSVGAQIGEALALHRALRGKALRARVEELLEAVGIPEPERRAGEYPHQLSGGMKQRVMIAAALAGKPELLVADEPTTALDVTTQAQILKLLSDVIRQQGMSMLFITHDLGVAANISDHIAVMKNGRIVERADNTSFFNRAPEHPYTRRLFTSLPQFMSREAPKPGPHRALLLDVEDLRVWFPIRKGVLRRVQGYVKAVDGVSLAVPEGRTMALVGESGSGKSTLGRGVLRLLPARSGRVCFAGRDLHALGVVELRKLRARFQIVFQDPYASMNPRMMITDIIGEGLKVQKVYQNPARITARVTELLEQVGLERDCLYRYPHEFSGGQRQRICIARALAVEPRLLVCDEPTSSLDVSVQAQILELLMDLQRRLGIAYLFITHDLGVVRYLADEVAVMRAGKLVEQGPVDILENPKHPYTCQLLASIPRLPFFRESK